jgi:hypothetical protein
MVDDYKSKHKGAFQDAIITYVNDILKPFVTSVQNTLSSLTNNKADKTGIPKKTSDLTNDGNGISSFATVSNINNLQNIVNTKVDKELKTDSESEYKVLSDNNLSDDLENKLNELDLIKIDTVQIYPVTFCDLDENGDIIYREDGSGDYLIARKQNLDIIAKPINVFTDDVTDKKYNITISNGKMILKEVI